MPSVSFPISNPDGTERKIPPRPKLLHPVVSEDGERAEHHGNTKSFLDLHIWKPVTGIAAIPLHLYSKIITFLYWITHPSAAYVDIMYWLMSLGYSGLVLYFAIGFYALILFFTLLIYAAASARKECLVGAGGTFQDIFDSDKENEDGAVFSLAFALSWTTFSTVGYGNTFPALAPEKCMYLNYFTLATAFVGVCYVGACGALLFGKIIQEQSEARVVFSQACTVRFGSGIEPEEADDDGEGVDTELDLNKNMERPIPCPILEFRILNKLHNIENGAICDATVACAAGVEDEKDGTGGQNLGQMDSSDKIVRVSLPKKMFHAMEMVNDTHPLFRRVWTLIHVLDDHSPLLTLKMRKRIANNHGYWPKNCNSAEKIKENLVFKEIILSFGGISKHISSEVRAQKVYNLCDVVIGYEFVRMIKKVGESIKVFPELLNDVTEQSGTDEPIPIVTVQRRPGNLFRQLSKRVLRVPDD